MPTSPFSARQGYGKDYAFANKPKLATFARPLSNLRSKTETMLDRITGATVPTDAEWEAENERRLRQQQQGGAGALFLGGKSNEPYDPVNDPWNQTIGGKNRIRKNSRGNTLDHTRDGVVAEAFGKSTESGQVVSLYNRADDPLAGQARREIKCKYCKLAFGEQSGLQMVGSIMSSSISPRKLTFSSLDSTSISSRTTHTGEAAASCS